MAYSRAWRNFKRMQDLTVATAVLIYAGAVVNALDRLPGGMDIAVQRTLVTPAAMLGGSTAAALLIGPLRRWLARYVWTSYKAGFGQTASSIFIGLGLLGGAALFIYWQVAEAANGGRYPAGVFGGYASGIGILVAQALLTRMLEREPDVRREIEDRS